MKDYFPNLAMNLYCVLVLTIWLAGQALAAATGFSLPTNGVYLAITSWRETWPDTNTPVHFDEELVWAGFCKGGKAHLWYPIAPAYFLKVRMFDAQGKEVPKTLLGKSYGSQFARLRNYRTTRLASTRPEGSYEENHGQGSGGFLPPPKDLFKMRKAGTYTMEVEMQMFRHVASTSVDDWAKNLVQFSPIKIKVLKDSDD